MTKFLADECTVVQTIWLMKRSGIRGPKGSRIVFQRAQELKAVLVTNDRGFGDVRGYLPSALFPQHRGHRTKPRMLKLGSEVEGAF